MSDNQEITGRQIAAARALLGLEREELAARANISDETLKTMEQSGHQPHLSSDDLQPVVKALQSAGVSFIDDNQTSAAGGPGVRLLRSPAQFDTDQSQTVQYKEHLAPDAPTGAGG